MLLHGVRDCLAFWNWQHEPGRFLPLSILVVPKMGIVIFELII